MGCGPDADQGAVKPWLLRGREPRRVLLLSALRSQPRECWGCYLPQREWHVSALLQEHRHSGRDKEDLLRLLPRDQSNDSSAFRAFRSSGRARTLRYWASPGFSLSASRVMSSRSRRCKMREMVGKQWRHGPWQSAESQ